MSLAPHPSDSRGVASVTPCWHHSGRRTQRRGGCGIRVWRGSTSRKPSSEGRGEIVQFFSTGEPRRVGDRRRARRVQQPLVSWRVGHPHQSPLLLLRPVDVPAGGRTRTDRAAVQPAEPQRAAPRRDAAPEGGDEEGLIGRLAGTAVKTLPSVILTGARCSATASSDPPSPSSNWPRRSRTSASIEDAIIEQVHLLSDAVGSVPPASRWLPRSAVPRLRADG